MATLGNGSVVSRCCARCGDAFSPVRIRRTVVSLSWVLPHVPCHTWIPIRDHYDFVLCHTYVVLPDSPPVYGGVYSAVIDYDTYIKCVKGDNGNALTLGKIFYFTDRPYYVAYCTIY